MRAPIALHVGGRQSGLSSTKELKMFNHQKLKCYVKSLDLAKKMPAITARFPYYLGDQIRRSISSVVLNISEGNSRTGPRERLRFFTIARASASESASVLDIALAYKLISQTEYAYVCDELLQVIKMLYKLR
jgi:four helix bundle protein